MHVKLKRMKRSGTEVKLEAKSSPHKPEGEITKTINSQNASEYRVNRMSSYFPKGGHSATQAELKMIRTHVIETSTKL